MSRALIVIRDNSDRQRAAKWAASAPYGCRIEYKETKRSLPQNSKFYAMLTDIARQKEHCGRKYPVECWKAIFMHALGREVQFVPSLDEKTFLPLGYHSSDLSKGEMSDLIEFMLAWGAENGVKFHDQRGEAAA
jgi:hypothetical protein